MNVGERDWRAGLQLTFPAGPLLGERKSPGALVVVVGDCYASLPSLSIPNSSAR